MANYRADLTDIEFNLFDVLKIQEKNDYGMDRAALKDILMEYEKFVRQEIFPSRSTSDKEGVHLKEGRVIAPESVRNVHKNFYANGWFALGLPEDIGGAPVPEALANACLSLSNGANTAYMMYPGLTKGVLNVIRLKGNDWMKQQLLPKMVEGSWGGTMCLTEAGAGSDVGSLRTTATPNGDGTWAIKGTKIFISSGNVDLYENAIHLVLARTPNAPAGTKGISLFVVPKNWVDQNGQMQKSNDVVCTKVEEKMGIHASATCELQFGGNNQCKGYLIGDEFDGMSTMFIMMNEARLLCGIQGESQANLAFELSVQYAKERTQFGQEIVHHPDVKKMLLKMRANARGMRQLALYTANLFDLEKKEHQYSELIGLLTPICKAHFTEQGMEVAVDAVQVHGGYGFCQEYGIEQFVRDTIIGKIYEGTNGIQAIDFTMRKIIKDQGKAFKWLVEIMSKDMHATEKYFSQEAQQWKNALQSVKKVTEFFFEQITKKNTNLILFHALDYLKMCSKLILAWQLGRGAQIAKEMESKATGADYREYLSSKVADYQLYTAFFLSGVSSLEQGIVVSQLDFWNCKI